MLSKAIAIIDDDPLIGEYLATVLEPYGHCYSYYASAESFLYSNPVEHNFSCLLIDWNLPGLSGLELIKQIRTWAHCPPVMMITGLQGDNDLARALHAGADEFITKPINKTVFLARFCALMRRDYIRCSNPVIPAQVSVDLQKRVLRTLSGETLTLSQKEIAILNCLISSMSELVCRETLLNLISPGKSLDVKRRNLDVTIFRLRKKLESLESVNIVIKSSYGLGYTISVDY